MMLGGARILLAREAVAEQGVNRMLSLFYLAFSKAVDLPPVSLFSSSQYLLWSI
jgi:hypothetical protein